MWMSVTRSRLEGKCDVGDSDMGVCSYDGPLSFLVLGSHLKLDVVLSCSSFKYSLDIGPCKMLVAKNVFCFVQM